MADKKLLLIWEVVPEETKAFVLDMDTEEAAWAISSAGVYCNMVGVSRDHDINKLGDWLEGVDPVPTDAPLIGPFETVVVCGFLL